MKILNVSRGDFGGGTARAVYRIHHAMVEYDIDIYLRGQQRFTIVESYIKGWASFNLYTEPDGAIYKPDSLYIEAIIEK